MRKLICDKCNELAYYVNEDYDGIIDKFCKKHAEEYLINEEYPSRIKTLKRQIQDMKGYIKCQNSPTGHDYEDITHKTLSLGITVYQCKRCGHQKREAIRFFVPKE